MSVTQSGFTIAKPSSPPSVAANAASGSLDTSAVYGYKVTFVTGFGETDPSSAGSTTTSSTGSIMISSIPVSADENVIGRKIYRTDGGGSTYKLLTTIEDRTTTSYLDLAADSTLGANAPTLNNASSRQVVAGDLALSKPISHSLEIGITAGAGGTSLAAYQLTKEINIIATVTTTNDSVKLPEANTIFVGQLIRIRNGGANTARIYPYDGQTINAGSADAPITVAAAATVIVAMTSGTNWTQV